MISILILNFKLGGLSKIENVTCEFFWKIKGLPDIDKIPQLATELDGFPSKEMSSIGV